MTNVEWTWLYPSALDFRVDDSMRMRYDAEQLEIVEAGDDGPDIGCYTWNAQAVTIGRLQDEEAARAYFPGLPIYRRPTGGKAVLHGDDLTIVACARHEHLKDALPDKGVMAGYRLLVEPVCQALRQFGIETTTGRNDSARKPRIINSEDCFATVARCDVIDSRKGVKTLGSAMRRTSKAILLQMSLKPQGGVDIFSRAFLDALRDQYTRYLNVGRWNIIESRD